MEFFLRKKVTLAVFVGLSTITLPALAQTADGGHYNLKRIVGDYGYWSRTQTPPYSSAQIPFHKLTHINHAGVNFGSDGSLSIPDGFLEPDLIAKAHVAGVKVVLLLGGDFGALETDSGVSMALVNTLVGNVQAFVEQNGYDGVDIDWEYPSSTIDQQTFFALMQALRTAFPAPRYVISADVAPWGGTGYDFPDVTPVVDYFNIMMYDCAGPWTNHAQLNSPIFPDPNNPAPYECEPGGSVKEAIDIYVTQLQIPPVKLNMGTPFYGYIYINATKLYGLCKFCQYTVFSENYGTFMKQRVNKNGWRTFYDPIALVPYMLRTDEKPGFITYDDPFSTYYRIWYSVWERGLGGSFMWSLDADYDGHSQDLLDAMYNASIKPVH
ncbi:MAG TPA: glycoside hydrolase family 18 protein [Bryobacteraceae bacterium]|nr:glycoside hydrolase family 18 protein [Bryobacteraceae bacterium]